MVIPGQVEGVLGTALPISGAAALKAPPSMGSVPCIGLARPGASGPVLSPATWPPGASLLWAVLRDLGALILLSLNLGRSRCLSLWRNHGVSGSTVGNVPGLRWRRAVSSEIDSPDSGPGSPELFTQLIEGRTVE